MSESKDTDFYYYIQPHPMNKRGYQIFKGPKGGDPNVKGAKGFPVGEYIVMDKEERKEITEQKIQALAACLNGQDPAVDMPKSDQQLVSFQRVGAQGDDEITEKIIFYNNKQGGRYELGQGKTRRSVNAILTFSKQEVDHTKIVA